MADSLEDLEGWDIFPIEPNWATRPDVDFELAKIIIRFMGSSAKMESYTEDVPEAWNFGFTPNKQEEYDLIDFFVGKYGMNGRFWMKIPATEFTLYSTALSGSTELRVENNYAHRIYQGRERIWIDMINNDVVTREVTDTTEETDYLSLSLGTSLDRQIDATNHFKICRLLLCRFDEDALIMQFDQDHYPSITLRVRELPNEYEGEPGGA